MTRDFFADAVGICERRFLSAGYSDQGSPDANFQGYLNVLNRRVPVQKRYVYKGKSYSVPSALASGEQQFLNAVINGSDLRPYQSTKIADPEFEDRMLNDFGIQHFHVGIGAHPTRPGFKTRTNPVLFAMIKGDAFYGIGFYRHGEWARQELLNIVYDNWPCVLTDRTVTGIVGLSRAHTDEELARLRNANINCLTQRPDGTVHLSPGGGQTAAGTSFNSSWAEVQLRQLCEDIERQLTDRLNGLASEEIRLEERAGSFVVRSTDGSFELPIENFCIPTL